MLVLRSCSCSILLYKRAPRLGFCPSRRVLYLRVDDDPTKPMNINPLSKPNTRTTRLNGTRTIIATSGVLRAACDSLPFYCRKPDRDGKTIDTRPFAPKFT